MSSWPTTFKEAVQVQNQLRDQVIVFDDFDRNKIHTIAGVDAGYKDGCAHAAVVVLEYPSLKPIDSSTATCPVMFPYVPGFLSFRESPAIVAAINKLTIQPHLLICDGQGIAHPRRFGVACHIGLLTGLPSIGCAKSRLIGEHKSLPIERGAHVPLVHHNETIGVVLRSKQNVRPLYVSVGHRISLETSIDFVLNCITKYRLPETTRAADALASHGAEPILQSASLC